MTKPRTKTREELTAEIEDGKKKIRQFENREKLLRQKLSREERRTRSHRLIVRGAVFESLVPDAKDMTDEETAALLLSDSHRCVPAVGFPVRGPDCTRPGTAQQGAAKPQCRWHHVTRHFRSGSRQRGLPRGSAVGGHPAKSPRREQTACGPVSGSGIEADLIGLLPDAPLRLVGQPWCLLERIGYGSVHPGGGCAMSACR